MRVDSALSIGSYCFAIVRSACATRVHTCTHHGTHVCIGQLIAHQFALKNLQFTMFVADTTSTNKRKNVAMWLCTFYLSKLPLCLVCIGLMTRLLLTLVYAV